MNQSAAVAVRHNWWVFFINQLNWWWSLE